MTTAIGAYATTALLKARTAIPDTTDDTVIGSICDQINQYIEDRTKRVLAPISSATYLYDGDGSRELYLPRPKNASPIGGVRAISVLEVAPYTGGTFVTLNETDYFLERQVMMTGPYELVCLSDRSTSGYGYFPSGYRNVRVTATAGWAAIPDSITDIALTAATRAWHAVQSGQTDIVGTDEMGRPLVSRFFSSRDYATLQDYAIGEVLISGR